MDEKTREEKVKEKIAKEIQVGDYVMICSRPCAVIQTRHSYPGKHVMKASIKGEHLLTGRKFEQIVKLEGLVEVIYPEFSELEVLDVDQDEMVSLLEEETMKIKEIKLTDDEELKKNFLEQFKLCQQNGKSLNARIVKVSGQQAIVSFKAHSK